MLFKQESKIDPEYLLLFFSAFSKTKSSKRSCYTRSVLPKTWVLVFSFAAVLVFFTYLKYFSRKMVNYFTHLIRRKHGLLWSILQTHLRTSYPATITGPPLYYICQRVLVSTRSLKDHELQILGMSTWAYNN